MSKEKQNGQESSLENFTWDTAGSSDFFGVPGSAVTESDKKTTMQTIIDEVTSEGEEDEEEVVTKIETKSKEKTKEKPTKKTEEKEEEEEVEDEEKEPTFFEEEEEEDEEEDEEDKPKEKKEKVKKEESKDKSKKKSETEKNDGQFFKTLASELKEQGIFQNVEIPEDKEELTEEEFFTLQDEEIESRVNETFEAFAEEMDDDGKAFIKFKKNGGNTLDFISVYVDSPVPDFGGKEFDASNETHRKVVLETYLTLVEKLDDEELSDRLSYLKENGKDKAISEKYYNKLVDIDAKQKEALLKQAEDNAKEREENSKKFNKTLSEALNKVDSVGKFKITKEDKKKLVDLITKPTVKVAKNKYIPSFHNKLGTILKAGTPEALNKLILLAKLVENDFDVKDLVTKVETEVTGRVKSKLAEAKNGVKPSSSGQYQRKSLSDFF